MYAATVVVVVCGVVLAPEYHPLVHFVRTGFVSLYSAALLYTAALLAAAVWILARTERRHGRRGDDTGTFWMLVSLGLLLVTLDEAFDLHGTINTYVTRELLGLGRSPFLSRTDAFVVAAYGAAAAIAITRNRAALSRVPWLWGFLWAGAAFAFSSTVIDLALVDEAPTMFFEDGAKVLAGASVVLVCLSALKHRFERLTRYGVTRPPARDILPASERASRAAAPGATEVLTGIGAHVAREAAVHRRRD